MAGKIERLQERRRESKAEKTGGDVVKTEELQQKTDDVQQKFETSGTPALNKGWGAEGTAKGVKSASAATTAKKIELNPTTAPGAVAGVRSAEAADPVTKALLNSADKQVNMANAMISIRNARHAGRDLTAQEQEMVSKAEADVKTGTPLPPAYVPISRFGERQRQTMLSLADVGQGHLDVTLKDQTLLNGLVVHHEHIDRESLDVAPYRMIDPGMNGVVRLHTADDAPVTVYYGRPNYQPDFKTDKVTPVNNLAAAAAGVFKNGTADVKVAMDGLTATETVDFMQRVDKATPRNKDQFFSAAFNLNTPLVDDRPATVRAQGKPVTLTDPQQIAQLGIELAKDGGWNKVAWDGASKKIPSTPFIELLGGYETMPKDMPEADKKAKAVEEGTRILTGLVHDAHSQGLETYISAGMKNEHMAYAAAAGVDGVGVGFSLHFREPGSGVVGPLDPNLIRGALSVRDVAESTVRGKGAKLLAHLDGLYAEGKLTPSDAKRRDELYQAVLAGDEKKIEPLLDKASVEPPGERGYYEGKLGLKSGPSPRPSDPSMEFHIPRHVDPAIDGTKLVKDVPASYGSLLTSADKSVAPDAFFAELEKTVPKDVLKKIDDTIAEAERLAKEGVAETPPTDKVAWRRAIIQSYLHSRDLTTIMKSLGVDKNVTGQHDLTEPVPAADLKWELNRAVYYDPWFKNYVDGLKPDEKVFSGFFNPNLTASMYKWGDSREGVQNAMDAHRLAPHHDANSAEPRDVVERFTNFVVHHAPREHMGIQHRSLGEWPAVEHAIETDPAIKDSDIGKQIARDAASMMQQLEREGKIVPWQKLKLPEGVATPQVERAYNVLQAQNAIGAKVLATTLGQVDALLPSARTEVQTQAKAAVEAIKAVEAKSATLPTGTIVALNDLAASGSAKDKALANAVGSALLAKYATLSTGPKGERFNQEMTALRTQINKPPGDFFEEAEVTQSLQIMSGIQEDAAKAEKGGDAGLAGVYRNWFQSWSQGFPKPEGRP